MIKGAWDELGRFLLIYFGVEVTGFVLRRLILWWKNRDGKR